MPPAGRHAAGSTSSLGGIELRCCARITGSTDGRDASGVFITGNRLELVPAGKSEGEKFQISQIYDAHATDRELCDAELLPLAKRLVGGSNVHVVTLGHHRGGHTAFADAAAPMLVDSIFDLMQQRQAAAGGQSAQLSFKLSMRAACVVIGAPESMSDLLGSGSSELRIVRDAEQVGGVQLAGLRNMPVSQPAEFAKLFKGARTRLTSQHKPPAPSSVLWLELEQMSRKQGFPDEVLISHLVMADIEVANLGDGLAVALRALVSMTPSRPPPPSGASLLLSDAIGGNSHALLLGCLAPSDLDESSATLTILQQGMSFRNYPLTNDSFARGLLQRHYWHTQTLHEQLVVAESKLTREVEQIASGQQQLPNQLVGATERLQALVDSMQQDASGQASERQQLMAEVMALRARLNSVSGECISLKEELMAEKKEKLSLSKQLVEAQLSGSESTHERQQRIFELEQEKLAANDVLRQLQKSAEESEAELKRTSSKLEVAEGDKRRIETQRLALQAELHLLQDEASRLRELEAELNMELLNATNGKNAAEAKAAELTQQVEHSNTENARLQEKSELARKELQEARQEADAAREQAAQSRLALERSQLQSEEDTLALQRQAANSAEEQLERIRLLQAELSQVRDEQAQERAAHANALSLAKDEVKAHDDHRREINMQLDAHKEHFASFERQIEIIEGIRGIKRKTKASPRKKAAAGKGGSEDGEGEENDDDAAAEGSQAGQAAAGDEEDEEAAGGDEEESGAADGDADGSKSSARNNSGESPDVRSATASRPTSRLSTARSALKSAQGSARGLASQQRARFAGEGSREYQRLISELRSYQTQVTATLESNRGLVEAYWRVRMLAEEAGRLGQPLTLPSHEELQLRALILENAQGRRQVPSELEKALTREKEAIENQLTAVRSDLEVAQQSLQQAQIASKREVTALQKELDRVRAQAMALQKEELRLQTRVDELEVAVPAQKNAELVNQLRRTQAELIEQLTALKSEGGLDPLPGGTQLPSSLDGTGLVVQGEPGSLMALAAAEKDELIEQVRELERQLEEARKGGSRPITGGSAKGPADVNFMRMQIAELEAEQSKMERERTLLTRRAIAAEEQLATMQAYVDTYMTKYQVEIVRLKQTAGK